MSANPRVSPANLKTNQTLNYTHDKTGLITSKNSTNYTYDNIGRLTQAGADSFSYDAAGNNQNDNAVYNILNNRLTASDIYTITYDSMGNIKTKYNKLTKETSNYTFNSRNQLVNYEQLDDANQTTKTLTYTYDAFNRRVSKTEDGVEQKYLYDNKGDGLLFWLPRCTCSLYIREQRGQATFTPSFAILYPIKQRKAYATHAKRGRGVG